MDKNIIKQALSKAFLSEANGTPAISLANKIKKIIEEKVKKDKSLT